MSISKQKRLKRICFDIETDPITDQFRCAATTAIKLKHAPKMRVACAYDGVNWMYFLPNEAPALIKLLENADEIISFNGKGFDILVLQRHYRLHTTQPLPRKGVHTDIHEIMSTKAGFRVSLNDAAQINLGERKHTAGRAMAALPLDKLKEACRSDVSQTYRLWQAHVDGTLRLPMRKFTGRRLELDGFDPFPGMYMPKICPACQNVGCLRFVRADEEMTEGQEAEYFAGTWGYATCLTCGHYDSWEMC